MKLNKLLLTAGALAMCGTLAFADDFDDFGSFEDFGSFGDDSASSSKLEVNGSISLDARAYVDVDDADELEVEATPSGKLDLSYSGNKSDLNLSLNVDVDKLKSHPEDVIDELVLRGYFGNFTLETGKMKIVWGKGDKLHVIDNFNADDYSSFIIPDYLDRRISTPMIRGIYSFPIANLQLEAVYTPLLPVDRFASQGRWTPAQLSAMTNTVTAKTTKQVADSFKAYTTATATVGAAGAAYTISTESAKKAAAALESATTSFNTAKGIYDSVNTKYTTLLNGYDMAKAQNNAITWDYYLANIAQVSDEQFEALRKGYSEAAAAYYAALAAKESAQTTLDGYNEAATKAETEYLKAKQEAEAVGTAYMHALTYANALSSDPSVVNPDLWSLKYGQFGGRATWTLGQFDLGLSYYNGWYKQPSLNPTKVDTFITSYLEDGKVSEDEKFLAYDKKQTFGVEASTVLWHFNLRGEFAYNLTDDVDGSNPWVHNNSIGWLGGFDIDLPFWNANLNVQEYGTYVLNGSKCDDNNAVWASKGTSDIDYAKNGYTNNKLVCNFSTSFMNDKLSPEVTVMYGFENGDLVLMSKFTYKPDQNLTLSASGMWINCRDDDSEFAAWKNNSFVNLGAEYRF